MHRFCERRGHIGSLFCYRQLVTLDISDFKDIVAKFLEDNQMSEYFWVDGKLFSRKLEIFLDGDNGIGFDICRKVSRHLESILDENQVLGEDYVLEVSSPGVGSLLRLPRQYKNNIGRILELKLENEKVKGEIISADDASVTIRYEVVELEGKKKKKYLKDFTYGYDKILEGRIKVSFK